jgi:hypothetical protein
MSIKVRPYRNGGWEVDIRVITPDGARQLRERRRATMSSKSAALRWAEGRERVLFERLINPPQDHSPRKEVPTFRAFAPRFLDGHARANRRSPAGSRQKRRFSMCTWSRCSDQHGWMRSQPRMSRG